MSNVDPGFMPAPANLLGPAYDVVNEVDQLVTARLQDAAKTADELYALAEQSISQLGGITIPNAGPVPAPPSVDTNFNIDTNLPSIPTNAFGEVTGPAYGPDPSLATPPAIPDISIPDFVSSISALNIPQPPSMTAPTNMPDAPTTSDVVIPGSPNIALPAAPVIADIQIPDFVYPTLPIFDETAPEFEGSPLVPVLQWAEPTYQPEILPECLDRIRGMWNGTYGLPPGVIDAMVQRAHEREETSISRDIDAVDDEYSLRGFTMPTGMQANRADQVRKEGALRKNSLNREITIQAAQWQIENVRAAVQNAIAAETVMVNLFTNQAERTFQAARFTLEAQIQVYNAMVSLFNAKMNGYSVAAQVYDTKVKAMVSQIQVYRAQIDAQIAKGQLEQTKAQIYATQLQGVQVQLGIYEAQLRGAQTQAEVNKTLIDQYRATIEAYATRINYDKVRFDAYDSQVRAEGTKASIIDSEARAYASLIQGKATQADIDVKRADVVIQTNRNTIEAYTARLEAERVKMAYQVSAIQAASSAYTADTQRFVAQAGAENAKAQVEISANESSLRTNVALYEARVKGYEVELNALIQRANLSLDAIKSAGSLSATLAAGAMSAVHVGASLSGGGSVGANSALSESINYGYSESKNESYTYEGT